MEVLNMVDLKLKMLRLSAEFLRYLLGSSCTTAGNAFR